MLGVDELPQQPRFADARLADHAHELRPPCGARARSSARLIWSTSSSRPTKGVRPARRRPAGGPRLPGARDLEHLHGRVEALDADLPEKLEHDVAFDQPGGVGGNQDGARRRGLLHARGQVRGLAHGGVVHAQVVPDRAHHHLAGVQSNPDADDRTERLGSRRVRARSPASGARRMLHARRGPRGRLGPEQRHDPVTHHLVDESVVLMDRRHHELEHGVEQRAGFLGIARRQELGRVLEIGEEHRHVLALALGAAPAPPDAWGCTPPARRWRRSSGAATSDRSSSRIARRRDCPENSYCRACTPSIT